MIRLSAEQEERAQTLQRESFIFDFFPRSEPGIPQSAAEEAVLTDAIAAGVPAAGAPDRLFEWRTRQIAQDPAAEAGIRDYWQRSGVKGVVCTLGGLDPRFDPHEAVVRSVARWLRRLQVSDYLTQIRSADEFDRSLRNGQLGLLFGMQDTEYLGTDLSNLDVLYNFGVRVIQLTYNSRNRVGDGCTERVQGGLTHFGVQVVKRMNELGIIVDLAHSGLQTTLDAVEISERPVAFTHTGCKALYNHPRSKTDDQLRAIAERDGYVGIYAVPFFLSGEPNPGIDVMLDHLEHAIKIVGIERVGIGTDLGSWSKDLPAMVQEGVRQAFFQRGFREEHGLKSGLSLGELGVYTDWIHITRGLVSRGYSDGEIQGILGRNFQRFMRRAIG